MHEIIERSRAIGRYETHVLRNSRECKRLVSLEKALGPQRFDGLLPSPGYGAECIGGIDLRDYQLVAPFSDEQVDTRLQFDLDARSELEALNARGFQRRAPLEIRPLEKRAADFCDVSFPGTRRFLHQVEIYMAGFCMDFESMDLPLYPYLAAQTRSQRFSGQLIQLTYAQACHGIQN